MRYFAECNADIALLQATLGPSVDVFHGDNKAGVLKLVNRNENSIGLIDQDPLSTQPSIMNELREVEESDANGLKRFSFQRPNRSVVMLVPRLEEWILTCCHVEGVNPESHNLPRSPSDFHAQVNLRLTRFSELLDELKPRCARIHQLRRLLVAH